MTHVIAHTMSVYIYSHKTNVDDLKNSTISYKITEGNRSSPKWHPMTSKWHNCRNSHCADLHVTWRIRDRPIRPEKVEKGQSKASRCQLQSGKTELETTRWSLTNLETFYSKIDKSINFVVDFDCVWSDI